MFVHEGYQFLGMFDDQVVNVLVAPCWVVSVVVPCCYGHRWRASAPCCFAHDLLYIIQRGLHGYFAGCDLFVVDWRYVDRED